MKKYWYEIFYEECVLCGSHSEYRERRYTPKPEDPNQRIHYKQFACGSHFA